MVGNRQRNSGEAKDWDQVLPDVSGGLSAAGGLLGGGFGVGKVLPG